MKTETIFITGAGGFIGSHLSEVLVENGYEVKAFVRYNSRNFWGWLETSPYKEDLEITSGDIRDYDSVRDAMKGIDIVFHLAALIGIPYSYVSPLAYIKTNVEGTYNVLQAARELGVKKIIHTSTSEVYGTARYVPIDENHPLQPQSPYSASKIGADQIALSFYHAFDLPVVIARPFNTYGPRQSARAVIPTIIIQILKETKRIELGNITVTRDLNYAKDIVEGFIKIMKTSGLEGKILNIGSGMEISIRDLADKIANLMSVKIEIKEENIRKRPKKSEVERLVCNSEKMKRLTDWTPKYPLDKGLKETIKWFKKNLHLYKSEVYNV